MITFRPLVLQRTKRNAFETYELYLALKTHLYQENYDFWQFQGKVRTSVVAFEKRNDRGFFYTISKRRDSFPFLLSNIIKANSWIGDIVAHGDDNYSDWRRRVQSWTYSFAQELDALNDDWKSNFVITNGQQPKILRLYLNGSMSPETFSLLVDKTNYVSYIDRMLKDDVIWKAHRLPTLKYKSFFDYDNDAVNKALAKRYK